MDYNIWNALFFAAGAQAGGAEALRLAQRAAERARALAPADVLATMHLAQM
jgi:hypothetical protein